MAADLLRLVACYGGGVFPGCLLTVPLFGAMALALFMFGVIVALPFLLAVAWFLALFRDPILRHLGPICMAIPIAITGGWALMLWRGESGARDRPPAQVLLDPDTLSLPGTGTLCAACGCGLFWLWKRPRAPGDAAADRG